jgi:hypothetical protein
MRSIVVQTKPEQIQRAEGSAGSIHDPVSHAKDLWARKAIFAIAFIGFVVSLFSFWPGFMEFDSFDQYAQAVGQEPLNDWHPVIMALLWRFLIVFHDGPQPMLLLQLALYWSGFLYLAWHSLQKSRVVVAVGAIVAPFFPFLLNFSGVVWKDTQLALALFWAALILLFARRSWVSAATSLALIFYGLAVRHNGPAAALPLLVLWSWKYAGQLPKKIGVLLCTGFVTAILLLTNFGINKLLIMEQTNPLHHEMLNEIAFIQCHSWGSFDFLKFYQGEVLKQQLNQAERQIKLCGQVDALASEGDTDDIFERNILKAPDDGDRKIFPLWLQNVIAHPLEYLEYRLTVYRTFLRPFEYARPYYVFCDGRDPNPFPDRFSSEPANPIGLTNLLASYIGLASKTLGLFFRPFFWLATLLVSAGISLWKKHLAAGLICLSGLCYLGAYLLFLPAPDFRYAYWAIFAQTLSCFLLWSPSAKKIE